MLRIFLLISIISCLNERGACFEQRCRVTRLDNGRVKEKTKLSNTIRFACNRGFQLFGPKYAHCVRGKWDGEMPICVKPGCRVNSLHRENALFYPSHRGALVKVVCNPGYFVKPDQNIALVYCNGTSWNGTFPDCQVFNENPAIDCSFENSDLCGWLNEVNYDFYWKQNTFINNSLEAYYLYIESSSPINTDVSAKIYSPVYPPRMSNYSCFTFLYQLCSSTTGVLKVYMKEEGLLLSNTEPLLWIEGGQDCSYWQKAFFDLTPTSRNFQIVIEGARGFGFSSIAAIANVSLKFNQECLSLTSNYTTQTTLLDLLNSTDSFDSITDFSCKGRCGDESVLAGTNITSSDLDESPKCDCHNGCSLKNTCCLDFKQYCSNIFITEVISHVEETSKFLTTTEREQTTLPSVAYTNIILPTFQVQPKVTVQSAFNASITSSLSPKVKGTISSKYTSPTTLKITGTSRPTSKKVTELLKTTKSYNFQKTTLPTTSDKILVSTLKTEIQKKVKISKEYSMNEVSGNKVKEISSSNTLTSTSSVPMPIHSSSGLLGEVFGKDGTKITIGTASASLMIVVVFVFVVWRKRRRRSSLQSIAEDSDVRFLTSDENLDFSLARPVDDDL